MAKILDTVLLLALPASGKSEVRKYLAHLPADECANDFHMGPTVQLDDFPYVHLMRRIDDELEGMGKDRLFFQAGDKPFIDARDWGTLIELMNEDHLDLVAKREIDPAAAAEHLFGRLDGASEKVGLARRMAAVTGEARAKVADALEKEAREQLADKMAAYPDSLDGKTLVIEFARGGPDGSSMPLEGSFGYQYSLAQLSEALLSKAVILYIWVTPEESRRKNAARTDPDDPGSILHHGVPIEVLMNDYGCCDMTHLEESAEKPGTVKVTAHGKDFHLPVARFDNRVDKSSFLREEAADWDPADVKAIHEGLKGALDKLVAAR